MSRPPGLFVQLLSAEPIDALERLLGEFKKSRTVPIACKLP